MSSLISNNITIDTENRIVIIDSKVVSFLPDMTGNNITTINNKCYIDGYELVKGKWKKTFLARYHKKF